MQVPEEQTHHEMESKEDYKPQEKNDPSSEHLPPVKNMKPLEVPPSVLASGKPKRQLTEAQRLAFLKGREKRMANLERKRQEKLEANKIVESARDIQTDYTPTNVDTGKAISNSTISPLLPDMDMAERVAKLVIDQMKTKVVEEDTESILPEIKKRGRPPGSGTKRSTKKTRIRQSDIGNTPPIPPPPQRSFNWM